MRLFALILYSFSENKLFCFVLLTLFKGEKKEMCGEGGEGGGGGD